MPLTRAPLRGAANIRGEGEREGMLLSSHLCRGAGHSNRDRKRQHKATDGREEGRGAAELTAKRGI